MCGLYRRLSREHRATYHELPWEFVRSHDSEASRSALMKRLGGPRRSSEPASYVEVKEFLEKRLQILEALHSQRSEATSSKARDNNIRSARSCHARKQETKRGYCSLCRKDHFLMMCEHQEQLAADRKKHIETNQLRLNYLGKYQVIECQSRKNYSACQSRHHTSLHDACREVTAISHVACRPIRTPSSRMSLSQPRIGGFHDFQGVGITAALEDICGQPRSRDPAQRIRRLLASHTRRRRFSGLRVSRIISQ